LALVISKFPVTEANKTSPYSILKLITARLNEFYEFTQLGVCDQGETYAT
jgi:hypothetical protein